MKRTKIICTIGPASGDVKTLTAMIKAGMNVARLNFSHGDYASHLALMQNVRAASKKTGRVVAILQDLQGPKIRIATLENPVKAVTGKQIIIGKDFDIAFDLSGTVKSNHRILIEDGKIVLRVSYVQGKLIHCDVENGGLIQSHKGVNLPDSKVAFEVFTKKDFEDLKFGLKNDVDFVALSFVRTAEDIVRVKNLIRKYAPKGATLPKVIAKIEKLEAIKNIDEIIREVDAIMIARGDLGVEMEDIEVPILQKNIISKAIQAAKPVIVATQMLESMINSPKPTRAEVSDVANAVIDKADAVMLSGESAFGKFPIETVTEMNNIIEATESSDYVTDRIEYDYTLATDPLELEGSVIATAVYDIAHAMATAAIIGTSETGFTARFIAQQRPDRPILLLTDNPTVYRQMILHWGVQPLFVPSLKKLKTIAALLEYFTTETKKMKLVKRDDRVVLVAGNPLGQHMNLIEIVAVK